MNSQSAVNYATGIMNDFFHSYLEGMNRIRWALARESPQTYGKSWGEVSCRSILIIGGTLLNNLDVPVHVNNLPKNNAFLNGIPMSRFNKTIF